VEGGREAPQEPLRSGLDSFMLRPQVVKTKQDSNLEKENGEEEEEEKEEEEEEEEEEGEPGGGTVPLHSWRREVNS